MPSKPIELPPTVARAFVKDMRAFFRAKDAIKADEIAARQLHALKPYNPRCGRISTGTSRSPTGKHST
jgi:hypothetical protein